MMDAWALLVNASGRPRRTAAGCNASTAGRSDARRQHG